MKKIYTSNFKVEKRLHQFDVDVFAEVDVAVPMLEKGMREATGLRSWMQLVAEVAEEEGICNPELVFEAMDEDEPHPAVDEVVKRTKQIWEKAELIPEGWEGKAQVAINRNVWVRRG